MTEFEGIGWPSGTRGEGEVFRYIKVVRRKLEELHKENDIHDSVWVASSAEEFLVKANGICYLESAWEGCIWLQIVWDGFKLGDILN